MAGGIIARSELFFVNPDPALCPGSFIIRARDEWAAGQALPGCQE